MAVQYDGRGRKFPIVIARGTDVAFSLTVTDAAGAPVNMSSATVAATIFTKPGASVVSFTSAVSGAGSNVVTLSLTDTQTAALTATGYQWSMLVTRGGDKRAWFAGGVTVVDSDNGGGVTAGNRPVTVDSELNVNVAISVVGAAGGTSFDIRDYGAVDLTGTNDSSAALIACLAAMKDLGGGTIIFPAGTIRIAQQIVLPNTTFTGVGSEAQKQETFIWRGQGAFSSGQSEIRSTGTTLLMTWAGSGATNDAKIVTYGLGLFGVNDISFKDTTPNANTPFIYTTNTTLNIRRCAFLGATPDTCVQDAIILGGTLKPVGTGFNVTDSAMQGYGTVIAENYFNRVRRIVFGRSYCNQVQIIHNYADKDCGTNIVGGACIEINGSLDVGTIPAQIGDGCLNNVVMGNYLHAINYYYGVKIVKGVRNVIAFNGFIDASVNAVAVARFEGVTIESVNYSSNLNVVVGNASQTDVQMSEDAMSAGKNQLLHASATEPAVLGNRVKMPLDSRLVVDTPQDGVATWRVTDNTTDFLRLRQGTGGKWEIGGPLQFVGNATDTLTTALTLGNNVRASDALLNFNAPTGNNNSIQFKRNNVNSWLFYDANSTSFYFRDSVNSIMQIQLSPGSATTGRVVLGVRMTAVAAQGIEYGSGGPRDLAGAGTPEAAITAPVGSTYRRTDGGAGTTFYVKESGTGNTGWVAK
jgi:hypothetical protein